MAKTEPAPKPDKPEGHKINFHVILTNSKGDEMKEARPMTVSQIEQLILASGLEQTMAALKEFAEVLKKPMSLARACEIALDNSFEHLDKNEGWKKKFRRGTLIGQINEAAEKLSPLALEAGDVSMLKDRVAAAFPSPFLVRQICLLLDPASTDK
jgi:hypothetical protein